MNKPNPSRPTSQEWKYEPLQVIGRTGRLLALGLLGKTEKSGRAISEMLRAVELVQDDTSWNCKSWAFSAIEASTKKRAPLRSSGFITDPYILFCYNST